MKEIHNMSIFVKVKDPFKFKMLIAKKGLMINTVATKANVHYDTVKKLCNNERIRPEGAKKISDALEIDEKKYDEFFIIEDISKSEQ